MIPSKSRNFLILLLFCAFPAIAEGRKDYIVLKVLAPLSLFPEKNSEVLRKLSFGEILTSENQKETNSKYFLLTDKDGLRGWVESGSVQRLGSKGSYLIVTKAIEKLLYQDTALSEMESIFYYLTRMQEGVEYKGDEFLFLKARRLVVLQRYLDKLQSPEHRSRSGSQLEELLRNFPTEIGVYVKEGVWLDSITNQKEGSKVKVRPEAYWRIAESYPNTNPGDFAAYLAVKHTPEIRCKKDPFCILKDEETRRLKYVLLQPNGNYARIYTNQIEKRLQAIQKDKDAFICDSNLPKEEVTSHFRKKLQELPARYGKKFFPYMKVLQEECLAK
ncbi:hypothetical protein CH373_15020 [Leptospira perolatii]|uniref:SH3 domain-containing protein n=1 Tax=Leptospira perolatii TaxID=2023191 RepID=A0A2M9ZJK2_9LEPT|nr:SH3 domain-containing protein [Leptospira perolatii]PJZ68580.1 hypothetical protein CH360_15475 [Leptospira perolatii]PJZ72235.1 hypothetical protein CH373_15020 [Leptospira perolatii]